MSTFTPPTAAIVPPFLPDSTPAQVGLFRHFASRHRGVNVFLLSDGSYVQDYPTAENSNTAIPYPIDMTNADPLNGAVVKAPPPFAYTGGDPSLGLPTSSTLSKWVVKIYYGGHANPVTAAEVTALTAAGYGAHIS